LDNHVPINERMPTLQLTGYANGPAPWGAVALLAIVWTGAIWMASEQATALVTSGALVSGVVVFWLLIPKARSSSPLPNWTLAPLLVAFVAGLFLASLLASIDRDLLAAGYGLWFVLWLQFGLWLKDRFGRVDESRRTPTIERT
jgi:hypothetical protein